MNTDNKKQDDKKQNEPEENLNKDLENDIFVEERVLLKKAGIDWQAWLQASRPSYYIVTLIPLFLAFAAVSKYENIKNWWLFFIIILASFLVHLATNLANDVFEHYQGIDAGEHIGGSRVLQEDRISLVSLAGVMLICYALALFLAIYIVHLSGQKILWLFITFAAVSSVFYVAPPIKYGHRALGELFVFINMGLIMVCAAYLALAGKFDIRVVALALPISFMVAGILYFQSLPEIETDKASGKTTLANFLGPEKADFLFLLLWPFIWVLMFTLYFANIISGYIFLALLSIPIYLVLIQKIYIIKERLKLDNFGYLARILYLYNGLILILAVIKN